MSVAKRASAAGSVPSFSGLPEEVFRVFSIEGFDERMSRLRAVITPRLRDLGSAMASDVTRIADETIYPHVALHLRRRVNPPDDTWVAFGPSARGYKALPHFEVGVDAEGVFTRFVLKPEAQRIKAAFLRKLSRKRLLDLAPGREVFWYRGDHGEGPVGLDSIRVRDWTPLKSAAGRKDASLSVGLVMERQHAMTAGASLASELAERLALLAPLYRLARFT